uniref:Uncharacterized protein n=1 Tax=Oryza rufipogon TaxID=4529 RepID=A0A0E0PA57_ORYRU
MRRLWKATQHRFADVVYLREVDLNWCPKREAMNAKKISVEPENEINDDVNEAVQDNDNFTSSPMV